MKVHLTTLGCPKNQVDSELMLGMLTEAGFPLTTEPEEAECLIVNTCAFIDRDRKSTRLNSSHVRISYAVFCLKKKKHNKNEANSQQQTQLPPEFHSPRPLRS